MSLEHFPKIVCRHEMKLVLALKSDTRSYAARKHARTRVNLDADGFVLRISEQQPENLAYRFGEDAYVLAVKEMEKVCCLSPSWPPTPLPLRTRHSRHCFGHIFAYDVITLAHRECGYVSPLIIYGSVFYVRVRITIYRRFLFGLVKYLRDEDLVRFMSVPLFEEFMKVFGCFENWIPGKVLGYAILNLDQLWKEYVPFLGSQAAILAHLIVSFEKEMDDWIFDDRPRVTCDINPCPVEHKIDRYLNKIL